MHGLIVGLAATQSLAAATILDLQPFRRSTTVTIDRGGERAAITLTNLNPRINAWYLLAIERNGASVSFFHLENPAPLHQVLELDPEAPGGLLVRTDLGASSCELWPTPAALPLEQARRSGASYAPLCDGRLYLRNSSAGYRTSRELVTEFLRDNVWGGEKLIEIVKRTVEHDAQLERSTGRPEEPDAAASDAGPSPAAIDAAEEGLRPLPAGLGIDLELATPGKVAFGRWYPARVASDIHVSVMQPGLVPAALLASHRDRVRPLDAVESEALVYLVAFDLGAFRLGYEVGTDHPRVGWSEHSLPQVREAGTPGPDGFDTIAPIVATGTVNPAHISRTVAAFTGGFKRSHGAFRSGAFALANRGSHYGWIEHGVVFSTLQPGLATLIVRDGGRIDAQTWQSTDTAELAGIAHARQNGVPLIELDPATGESVPGALVGNWSMGNWSGSASGALRTVRSGVCVQERGAERFLIYGYFSSVTPSAMARIFQAYHCRYGMMLDMNALEHTYLALYDVGESGVRPQHLVHGMEAVDRTVGGSSVPRFIGYPDNRDFFYVLRKQEGEP